MLKNADYFFKKDMEKTSFTILCRPEDSSWDTSDWDVCVRPDGDKIRALFLSQVYFFLKIFRFAENECNDPPAKPTNGGISDWNSGDPPKLYGNKVGK